MAAAQLSLPLDFAPEPVRAHGLLAPARLRGIEVLTLRGGLPPSHLTIKLKHAEGRKKGERQSPGAPFCRPGALASGDSTK